MKITILRSELPRTRLGKIQRFLLENLAVQEIQKSRDHVEPDYPEYRIIRDFMTKACECTIHPEDHLEIDLGLDSLDKVNLITFLQNSFGITAGESIFSECSTVAKLADYCRVNKIRMSSEQVDWQAILKEKIDLPLPKSWFSHRMFQYFLKVSFKVYFRLKSRGLENLPLTSCIITPNHQSFIDGFYISSMLKSSQLKQTLFFAKEKHLRRKWQKFLASRHNVIIMDINKDLKDSLQRMASAIKNGKNIIIFPEGTRTKDGSLGRFKKFFAILSKELNVPVVPVVIQGAYDALPTGRHLPKFRHPIQISFEKPIFPQGHTVDSLQESVYQVMQQGLTEPI
jgi:long-chain acyl-CoA synthetase